MSKPTDAVKAIEEQAIESANACKYCIGCKHSYLHETTGAGFCTWTASNSDFVILFLKPIEEFDTCNHWEKKEEEK
jgi:hypothetical protein